MENTNAQLRDILRQKILEINPEFKDIIDSLENVEQPSEHSNPQHTTNDLFEDNKLLLEELKAYESGHNEMMEMLETQNHELEFLTGILASIATAIGACRKCLGQNNDCPVCHGHGKPGTYRVNKLELNRWIGGIL